jgi:hypothetical protein
VVRPYFTEQKQVLPFDKVIELETIDDRTFRSIVKAYSPTGTNILAEMHQEGMLTRSCMT